MQSGLCLCFFPLAAFVISCSAGLSALEGLQPLGLRKLTLNILQHAGREK